MPRWNLVFLAFLIGGLSGFLSAYTAVILFTPGVLFGIIVGFYLVKTGIIKNRKTYYLFVVASTISYLVALYSLQFMTLIFSFYLPVPLAGGVIGAFLLLLSVHTIIAPLKRGAFLGLLILGAALSLFYSIGADMIHSAFYLSNSLGYSVSYDFFDIYGYNLPFFSLFVIWQAGMAAGIVWATTQKKQANNIPFIIGSLLLLVINLGIVLHLFS